MYRYVILFFICIVLFPNLTFGQSAGDLQRQIDARNEEIRALENEIRKYQNQVNEVASQAQTLQSTLATISANQKQLQSKIQLTNKNILKTNDTIKQNEQKIVQLKRGIVSSTSAVEELMRSIHTTESTTFVEMLASGETLSSFLGDLTNSMRLQSQLKDKVVVMIDTKDQLEQAQKQLLAETEKLKVLIVELSDQERLVAIQKKEQDDLLKATKNQESEFRAILADRQARKTALDAEVRNFESQLQFILDPKTLPKAGSGVLGWPLSDIYITQQFGTSAAAKRLYTSGSHNGVDFRAPVGTAVFAVADGKIEGAGDTDVTCPRASFGKWIFIRHTNGLATTYGHLSLIKVKEGQMVKKGDLIGYSGNTGYSTGPHLHISVYASKGVNGGDGVRVMERPSASCAGKVYRMPIAPIEAYLDPMQYLPRL